jgi:DNA repair protein RadC
MGGGLTHSIPSDFLILKVKQYHFVCLVQNMSDDFEYDEVKSSLPVYSDSIFENQESFYFSEYLRPREKLCMEGPGFLSDKELLMILLNTGVPGKNVSLLAGELSEMLDHAKSVPSIEELVSLYGLGKAKACVVTAMLELGRRKWGHQGTCIKSPDDVYAMLRHYSDRRQERFISISMNGAHEILAIRVVTIGLVNKTVVHPREVFSDLLQDRASAVCVAHNHPSGKIQPSKDDDETTFRLKNAAELLGLHFLDHIIFSNEAFFSYKRHGLLT